MTARPKAWRRVLGRVFALLLLLVAVAAWGDSLDFLGALAWSAAMSLVFAACMIRFSRAGFAFVVGGVAGVTLVLPLALVLFVATALGGERPGASLAAWFLEGDPVAVVFERLLPTLATLVAWPMLARLLRPRVARGAA